MLAQASHAYYFENFVEGDIRAYMQSISRLVSQSRLFRAPPGQQAAELALICAPTPRQGEWGDHVEIQAMMELYDRPVEIYIYSTRALLSAAVAGTLNAMPRLPQCPSCSARSRRGRRRFG